MENHNPIPIKQLLFQPFNYIAGGKALLAGILIILISGCLSYFSDLHFDGVIDIHTGFKAPFYIHLLEGFIDWLILSLILLPLGAIFSTSSVRPIDVFGTQALARAPMFIVAIASFILPHKNVSAWLENMVKPASANLIEPDALEWISFGFLMLFMIGGTIWMVALMFQAYKISTNLKGWRVVVSFIFGLLMAEIISKLFLNLVFKQITDI